MELLTPNKKDSNVFINTAEAIIAVHALAFLSTRHPLPEGFRGQRARIDSLRTQIDQWHTGRRSAEDETFSVDSDADTCRLATALALLDEAVSPPGQSSMESSGYNEADIKAIHTLRQKMDAKLAEIHS